MSRHHKNQGALAGVQSIESDALHLEAALTQSTFGHIYALMQLEEENSYLRREEIMAELEACRDLYFEARARLEVIDPSKLVDIEAALKDQKKIFFQEKNLYH